MTVENALVWELVTPTRSLQRKHGPWVSTSPEVPAESVSNYSSRPKFYGGKNRSVN